MKGDQSLTSEDGTIERETQRLDRIVEQHGFDAAQAAAANHLLAVLLWLDRGAADADETRDFVDQVVGLVEQGRRHDGA